LERRLEYFPLSEIAKEFKNNLLQRIKHLALDLDGTLYLDGKLFAATLPFLASLRRLGIGRTFFTNNSSKSTRQYLDHLRKVGIDAEESDIYSSTICTIRYLRSDLPKAKRLFVLGTPALQEEFSGAGFGVLDDEPDAVIVGFDTTLQYERVCRAAWWISRGKPYIATHGDRVCPTALPTVLVDCGAICAMLTTATGRQPDVVLGKPHRRMLTDLLERHKIVANNLGVVGDRLYTDMEMARAAGATGILVLSGETTLTEAKRAEHRPALIVSDVGELQQLLERSRVEER
jgi:HAD superfamily hydrolase (TIGR01450 family)